MFHARQHDPLVEEHSTLGPVYKSFASSLTICLSFSALALAAVILRYLIRSRQCPSPSTPPADFYTSEEKFTTATFSFVHNMSRTGRDSFPPPTSESLRIDPVLGDPLAGVYFPITSGQLAALADKKAAEDQSSEGQGQGVGSEGAAPASEQSEPLEARLEAYIRYFEDRQEGETWQRRVVHFQPPEENKQNVT